MPKKAPPTGLAPPAIHGGASPSQRARAATFAPPWAADPALLSKRGGRYEKRDLGRIHAAMVRRATSVWPELAGVRPKVASAWPKVVDDA
jgi:hypothetical protein